MPVLDWISLSNTSTGVAKIKQEAKKTLARNEVVALRRCSHRFYFKHSRHEVVLLGLNEEVGLREGVRTNIKFKMV